MSNPGHYDEYPELTREAEKQELVQRVWEGDSSKAVLVEQPQPITDTQRVDFHLAKRTTWYPDHREQGVGILCYDAKPNGGRIETTGKTWRDAVDAAIRRETKWAKKNA